jgi:uncharacterized delta-60 repeat protein
MYRAAVASSVALLALLAVSPSAWAAAGSLDSTFDGDGRVTLDLGSAQEGAVDVAVQPDGKIVVLGTTGTSGVLARYNSTGALDTAFDSDGVLVFSSIYPSALALQPDGKIIVAGFAGGGWAVARFEDDGAVDSTFETTGWIPENYFDPSDIAGVALQSDGKIVVVGSTGAEHELGNGMIVRFSDDGKPDETFAGFGYRLWPLPSGTTGVAVQPNDKIVVVGWTIPGYDADQTEAMAVARYLPDGKPDSSFDGDGRARIMFGRRNVSVYSASARPFEVALQADGKMVLAGHAGYDSDSDFALARFTSKGKIDTTFSGDGKRRMDFSGGDDEAHGLVIQANGRIVVGGFAAPSGDPDAADFALARYWPNGDLDRSFSANGKQRVRFGTNDQDYGFAAALQAGGKIVVAGKATLAPDAFDLGVARFLLF